jgi:lysophospholipase L1-like esterase
MKRTILLGDSITEWNPLKHNEILNLGIAGDTTQDILLRVEEVRRLKCRKIIFKAGINDILKKFSLEKSCDLYKNILKLLQTNFEEIILLSVLPIEKHERINMKVRKLNKDLEKIAVCNNFKFLDLYHLFCDEKLNLKSEYSTDGIHLSPQGYDILNKEILKLL